MNYFFQAIEALKQISDGSIDDIDFNEIQSTIDNLEIKEEVHVNEDLLTNDNSPTLEFPSGRYFSKRV